MHIYVMYNDILQPPMRSPLSHSMYPKHIPADPRSLAGCWDVCWWRAQHNIRQMVWGE